MFKNKFQFLNNASFRTAKGFSTSCFYYRDRINKLALPQGMQETCQAETHD